MGVLLASHMQTLECTGVMSGYTTETRTEKIKKVPNVCRSLLPLTPTHTQEKPIYQKKNKKHLFPTRVHREATTCPVSETQSLLLQLLKITAVLPYPTLIFFWPRVTGAGRGKMETSSYFWDIPVFKHTFPALFWSKRGLLTAERS